jgi:hypothetical protein
VTSSIEGKAREGHKGEGISPRPYLFMVYKAQNSWNEQVGGIVLEGGNLQTEQRDFKKYP